MGRCYLAEMAPIWKRGKKGDKKKLLKQNTRLDQFMYEDDKKAAIDFWFAQPMINLNDDRMWSALKKKLKETKVSLGHYSCSYIFDYKK